MKSIASYALYVYICLIITPVSAQTINWANREKGHWINANVGAHYGVIYGLGYGYKTHGNMPLIAKLNFSVPSGDQPFDDFSTKYGVEMAVLQWKHIHATAAVQGIYRRFQNDLVTVKNFGGEASMSVGLYKPRWFAAAEVGFDKAIVSHFRHSSAYREEFTAVTDGWYEPPTGGNFNYGLRAGVSFKQNDLTLRLGNLMAEDLKAKPMLPFYVQIGYNHKIYRRTKH